RRAPCLLGLPRPALPAGGGRVTVFCGAMVGASMGFLWWNCYPAQVFMGDVGSLSLGGALGTVAILIKQELLLFSVGGLFVLEAVSVIIQVLSFKLTGKRVFRMAPLHHHFELVGWKEPQIIIRFWIVAFVFALFSPTPLKLRWVEAALELEGQGAVVVGVARPGIGAAAFLARRGARVVAADRKPAAELSEEALSLR